MHYFIDRSSKRGFKSLSETFPHYDVVTDKARIDWLLNTKGMTRYTAQMDNMQNAGLTPVTAMFKQWGEPAHGISGGYVDNNLWVTYASTPFADIGAYYHVQDVKTAWENMTARDGLIVPVMSPWEGHKQRCDYLVYEETVNTFKLQYGYTTPGNFVNTIKVHVKRNEAGRINQWVVSRVTGKDRMQYQYLVGWSF